MTITHEEFVKQVKDFIGETVILTPEIVGEIASILKDYQDAVENVIRLTDERDDLMDAIVKIDNWAKAYPLDVFPEPDMKRVRELLEAGGIAIDCVSASNMRHVISRVSEITSAAIAKVT